MPEQRYEAQRQTLGTLLSTTSPRIEVPEWQRSYSWDSGEVEAFWQDLVVFEAQYPGDTIGSEEYFLGSIVLVTGGPTNLLLDGQQRLGTATILLSVLRDARRDYKADAATRLHNKYISDYDDETDTSTHVLTLNLYDRDFFRTEIQDVPPPDPRPRAELKSHGLIRKAREYFEARVRELTEAAGGGEAGFQRNIRIARVLCDHMSVVAVTSTDEDNAAAVFETLNDRGIGLSTPDLMRNLLLRRAPDDDSRDRIVSAWQTVLNVHEEANVDELIRHFWVSRYGDVKARKLYREIKAKVTGQNIESLALSLELAESAVTYRDIVQARVEDADLRRSLEGIRMLGAKSLYPALLSGFAVAQGGDAFERLRQLASVLTVLFVRHNVIGGRETTVMESTVYNVAAELRSSGDFDAAVKTIAEFAPGAEEFQNQFERASISRIATVRYILREIEHKKRITAEVAVEGTDRVHVEHIYPQTPEGEKWQNHTSMINRIGNLTLLAKRLNAAIRNKDFGTKKEEGYKDSDLLMTKELLEIEDWNTEAIEERQRQLAAYAPTIWTVPGEDLGVAVAADAIEEASPGRGAAYEGQEIPPAGLPEVPTG